MKNDFIIALEENNLSKLQKIYKSDLHNHATRGGNIKFIEEWAKVKINSPQLKFKDLSDMQDWYDKNIKIYCQGFEGYIKRIEAAFAQAKEDGIKVLNMSFGIDEICHFNNNRKSA